MIYQIEKLTSAVRQITQTARRLNTVWLVGSVHKFIIIFQLGSFIMIIWKHTSLPPLVPLWYSKPLGAEQLAHPAWILALPVAGVVIYLVNLAAATYITQEYPIFTYILFITSGVVNAALFIALLKIIFLVV